MALDTTIGGSTANSYSTAAEFDAYALAMGWTVTATEAALRRAALYLDSKYTFIGVKNASTQALDWPRYDAYDADGYIIANTTIPQALKNAQFEAAKVTIDGGDLLASFAGSIKREKNKAGPAENEVEYIGGSTGTRYPAIEFLLRGLLDVSAGQVRLVRA